MRGLLPPTPLGPPPGGAALAALGLSDRLARPGNVKEDMTWRLRKSQSRLTAAIDEIPAPENPAL
eukprot:8866886-Pyramimonas_sp.AAC.1